MSRTATPTVGTFDQAAEDLAGAVEAILAAPAQNRASLMLVTGEAARASGWAARAAVALAAGLAGRGRRVLLVDLSLDSPELHDVLGEMNHEGVADIFLFGASLRSLARPAAGGAFDFLAAGAFVPDAGDVLGDARWPGIVEDVQSAGAMLLAYVPAGAPGLDRLAAPFGGAVLLSGQGEDLRPAAGVLGRLPVLAVLRRDGSAQDGNKAATAAPAAAGAARERAGSAREPVFRARRPPSLARQLGLPVLLGALVVLLFFAALWGYQRWLVQPDPDGGLAQVPGAAAPAADPQAAGQGGDDAAESTTAGDPPAAPVETSSRAAESPIPFSVAVEAHTDLRTAEERVAALRRAEPGIEFYVAPVLVRDVVYFRVLAGPAADLRSADTLMQRLVEQRLKTAAERWAIRPTAWAFHLGDFFTRNAARARGDELRAQGNPTYVIEIPHVAGPSRYRLYAGAYEGPAEAEVMAGLLREAGLSPRLIERMGRPAS